MYRGQPYQRGVLSQGQLKPQVTPLGGLGLTPRKKQGLCRSPYDLAGTVGRDGNEPQQLPTLHISKSPRPVFVLKIGWPGAPSN